MILLFVFIFLVIGVFGGFLAGLFGIGGGILFVPVMLATLPYFHATPANILHVALATSFALVIPGGVSASVKQLKLKHLDFKLLASWVPCVIVGSLVGVFVVELIPDRILQIIFSVFMVLVTLHVIFKKTPKQQGEEGVPGLFARIIGGFLVGSTAMFFGVGGGILTVPFYVFFSYPMKKAIAVSSFTSIFIGAIGVAGMIYFGFGKPELPAFSFGYLNWFAFVCLAPTTFLMAPVGVMVSNKVSDRCLKWLYVAFLLVVTVYVFYKTYVV